MCACVCVCVLLLKKVCVCACVCVCVCVCARVRGYHIHTFPNGPGIGSLYFLVLQFCFKIKSSLVVCHLKIKKKYYFNIMFLLFKWSHEHSIKHKSWNLKLPTNLLILWKRTIWKKYKKMKMTYFDKIWFYIDIYPSFQEEQS